MMNVSFHKTSIGRIGIAEEKDRIVRVYFTSMGLYEEAEHKETPLIKEAFDQLYAYLDGKLKEFSLPLNPKGTEYMKKIWEAICKIPYGNTATYMQIAELIGEPNAARAVGLAGNKNPIPVFIPSHRIISSDNRLKGFGSGLEVKKQLLELEGSLCYDDEGQMKFSELMKL